MHDILVFVAGFGWWPVASGVLIAAFLLTIQRRRDRLAWSGLIALVGAVAAVLALRAVVSSLAEPFAGIGLVKPSGHAALAVVVYGTIGFVYGRHLIPELRHAARVACLALMLAIPSAMVLLGFHTVPDVLVGAVAGFAALRLSRPLTLSWLSPAGALEKS
jgi:hypothetical protein